MVNLTYSIIINAPKEQVYKKMLDKPTYQQWTSVFNPTSTYEGSWSVGSKMYFIGFSEDGKKQGMVAEIVENIENTFVSICHKGTLDGEIEVLEGPEVEGWVNALENYSFDDSQSGTKLTIHLDSMETYQSYFDEKYPAALLVLKSICEL